MIFLNPLTDIFVFSCFKHKLTSFDIFFFFSENKTSYRDISLKDEHFAIIYLPKPKVVPKLYDMKPQPSNQSNKIKPRPSFFLFKKLFHHNREEILTQLPFHAKLKNV